MLEPSTTWQLDADHVVSGPPPSDRTVPPSSGTALQDTSLVMGAMIAKHVVDAVATRVNVGSVEVAHDAQFTNR